MHWPCHNSGMLLERIFSKSGACLQLGMANQLSRGPLPHHWLGSRLRNLFNFSSDLGNRIFIWTKICSNPEKSSNPFHKGQSESKWLLYRNWCHFAFSFELRCSLISFETPSSQRGSKNLIPSSQNNFLATDVISLLKSCECVSLKDKSLPPFVELRPLYSGRWCSQYTISSLLLLSCAPRRETSHHDY